MQDLVGEPAALHCSSTLLSDHVHLISPCVAICTLSWACFIFLGFVAAECVSSPAVMTAVRQLSRVTDTLAQHRDEVMTGGESPQHVLS